MTKGRLCTRLLKDNWSVFAAFTAMQVCAMTVAPLALGWLIRVFFDRLAAAYPELPGLGVIVLLMLALAFARMGILLAATWLQVTTEYTVLGAIWHSVLENVLCGFAARPLPAPAGEVQNRLREDGLAVAKFASGAVECIGVLGGSVSAIAVMVHTSPAVAAAAVLPMFLSSGVTLALKPRLHRALQEQRAASAHVTSLIGDVISGIESIQCASAEQRFAREFARRNLRRGAAVARDRVLLAATRSSASSARLLGMGGMLLVGTRYMREGAFSLGDLAFFGHMLPYVAGSFERLSDMLASYGRLDVVAERLDELISSSGGGGSLAGAPRPPRARSDVGRAGSVAIKREAPCLQTLSGVGLSFTFSRDCGAGIHGVSFELRPGTLTIVAGEAGAGKSTLLRCVVGQLPLGEGRLLWNGEPILHPRDFFQPPVCAVCPQVPHFFDASVRTNIELGLRLSERELEEALGLGVLDQDIATCQLGLETRVGSRGRQLSGGQLQRLSAARMFARKAQLYVFDDLTRSLDASTDRTFWRRLSGRLERGAAALAVSHSPAALQRADAIMVIANGKVVAQGTLPQLLREHPQLMADITRCQQGARLASDA